MSKWKAHDLDSIGRAEELQLASEREDGTFRRPVTMWVVRVADELYVRSVNGDAAVWYRGALERRRSEISAGGAHDRGARRCAERAQQLDRRGVPQKVRRLFGEHAEPDHEPDRTVYHPLARSSLRNEDRVTGDET